MDLVHMLEEVVKKYPDKEFLISPERRMTFAQVDADANKVASMLLKLGLKHGERVALMSQNRTEFVTSFFGILKTGATVVALDTRYRFEELASIFDNCKPAMVIGESCLLEPVVPALSRFQHIRHVIDLDDKFKDNCLTYAQIMARGSTQKVKVDIKPDDIATISYSGGPTIRPTGAMLPHRSMAQEGMIAARGFNLTEKDRYLMFALPMYHNFALCSMFLASIYAGCSIVIVPGTGVSIHSLMDSVEREKGTIWVGVPYIFALAVMLAEKEGVKHDLSSLRLCISGGAPLRVETLHSFKKHYGLTLADVWGLTESSSHLTCMALDGTGKIGTVGRVLPGWELKIVDDDGRELPNGQVGEIIVRGPMMVGYCHSPWRTTMTLKDGWLHTGDLGSLDSDGYVTFDSVKKEMMVLKGQNVYPHDIEEVLITHPAVARVKVIGIPDKLRGETVGAAVVLKPGLPLSETELKRFGTDRMADYKIPRHIVFVKSLPESPGGPLGWKEVRRQLLPLFTGTGQK